MDEFYFMEGPRGQVHAVSVRGREHVALWSDMLAAIRYKTRHPGFADYRVVPLDRLLYEEKFLDRDGRRGRFFLMSGANPGLEVERGRIIEAAEIEAALYPATFGGRAPLPLHISNAGAQSASASAV